jgi:ABC-type nickel/cobalt efflux system permease component RcnA
MLTIFLRDFKVRLLKSHELILIVFCIAFICFYNSHLWQDLVYYIASTQLTFHKLLNAQVMKISNQEELYGFSLIGISFVYGIFHALGPGHGKAVIVSYLASNPQSRASSCLLAFTAAMFQALSAILLVTSLSLLLKYKYTQVELSANHMSLVGYGLLLILSGYIALKSIVQLYQSKKMHTHSGSCCANVDPRIKNKSLWQLFMVAVAIGLRPCSGALLILVSSSLLGIYQFGILGTFAMSLGTALSTGLIALASQYATGMLNKTLTLYGNHRQQKRYHLCIQLTGSLFIMLLAWSLINANNMLTNPIL